MSSIIDFLKKCYNKYILKTGKVLILLVSLILVISMTVYAIDDWNHETFVTTVLASKRNANITPKQFEAIQERKKKA
ncbi:MAG: hypothetical protein K6U03_01025, partial [Firmicutes bacterium]|nr:hypothetical protein [Bacillota bacterium]